MYGKPVTNNDLLKVLELKSENNKPIAIIANTIKGKGISFIENQVVWHHKLPSEEEYNNAIEELNIQLENFK